MAITFRTSQGTALTHAQMDENFSSVYFSSSIHDIPNSTSKELKLWFDNDTDPLTYDSVTLPAPGGSGTVTISGDVNNRVLTANGNGGIVGEANLTFDGNILTLAGRFEPIDTLGNLSIGNGAGLGATTGGNVLIGASAGQDLGGTANLAVGDGSLSSADQVDSTVAIGNSSLTNFNTGYNNTAIGFNTAEQVSAGNGNIYVGHSAGPATLTATQNNKLYINNSADDTPLIYGDFATGQVTFNSQVSASVFSGSFVGNGSALTGVSTEWDGTRDGNAQITGSLIVSGSTPTTVQFLNMTAISGSVFSGSFVGDGSGLTGIVANSEWDGTRNGNAEITGSFIVSGSSPTIDLKGVTTIHNTIKIHNPVNSSIGIGTNTLNYTPVNSIAIGQSAGAFATSGPSISIGVNAGIKANTHAIHIGYNSGISNTGERVIAIGGDTLFNATYAGATVAIGYRALQGVGVGKLNVAIGDEASVNIKNGAANTSVGANSLRNLIQGDFNTAVGYEAGSYNVTQGTGNVYLGPYTGNPDASAESNQLYIDNRQRNNALIRGDFEEKTLTFNALQVIIPNLPTDPGGLPVGALYRSENMVCVVI